MAKNLKKVSGKALKEFKCVGCGNPTGLGIPYCICKRCIKVLDNFSKVKNIHTKVIRKRFGIEELKFDGKGDTIYSVNIILEQIADIEEQLKWIKNGLTNIANHSEDKRVAFIAKNPPKRKNLKLKASHRIVERQKNIILCPKCHQYIDFREMSKWNTT